MKSWHMTNVTVVLAYDTLCWQGGRLSWTGALSVLPQRQLHLYHSLQAHSTTRTKACLRIRVCRLSRTCITQGQPCLRDLYMVTMYHGWGILAGPILDLEGFWLQKQKGSADSQGLKHPGALGRHESLARWPLKRSAKHIPGIYLEYAGHMLGTYIPHTSISESNTIFAGLCDVPSLGSEQHMSLLNHDCCYTSIII
jgi:hypothetical protein